MAATVDRGHESFYSAPAGSQGSGHDAMDDTSEGAHGVWSDAKETARARLNEQKDAAADGIGKTADALRDAARRSEGEEDGLARLTSSAAAGLDRVSDALRNKDVGTMLRDVESFARSQPVAFFGIALAVGFLAVRFMKSSDSSEGEQPWT